MDRLTHERCNGIKTGYWSAAKKEELIQRLAAYENTGLEPEQIEAMQGHSVALMAELEEREFPWISTEDRLPTEEDANKIGYVIAIMEHDGFPRSCWYDLVVRYPHLYPYWMPLPEPPEEGSHDL